MAAKFEIAKSKNGQFFFRLKAANGQIILSSEQYKSKASVQSGIASVKANAKKDDNFERKSSKSGQPYFVLTASNAEPIGSSEMYSSKSSMENGIASVKANAPKAAIKDLT